MRLASGTLRSQLRSGGQAFSADGGGGQRGRIRGDGDVGPGSPAAGGGLAPGTGSDRPAWIEDSGRTEPAIYANRSIFMLRATAWGRVVTDRHPAPSGAADKTLGQLKLPPAGVRRSR